MGIDDCPENHNLKLCFCHWRKLFEWCLNRMNNSRAFGYFNTFFHGVASILWWTVSFMVIDILNTHLIAILFDFRWFQRWFISSRRRCNITASSCDVKEPSNFRPVPSRRSYTTRWVSISDWRSCEKNENTPLKWMLYTQMILYEKGKPHHTKEGIKNGISCLLHWEDWMWGSA